MAVFHFSASCDPPLELQRPRMTWDEADGNWLTGVNDGRSPSPLVSLLGRRPPKVRLSPGGKQTRPGHPSRRPPHRPNLIAEAKAGSGGSAYSRHMTALIAFG